MKQSRSTAPHPLQFEGGRQGRPFAAWRTAGLACAALAMFLGGNADAEEQATPFDTASAEKFLASVAPADEPYLVHTGARWILPRPEGQPEFQGDRAVVFLQFTRGLDALERGQLERIGVRFHAALTQNTYLAKIRSRHLGFLRSHPLFHGIEDVQAVDKLTRPLYEGQAERHAQHPDGSMDLHVRFHGEVSLEHALAVLDRWDVGVPSHESFAFNSKLLATATHGQILALAEEPAVRKLSPIPGLAKDDNLAAAALSNIDDIQAAPFNLTGTGVRIGMWESGNPLLAHGDLTGRVTIIEDNGTSDHACHVAGTMIGDGSGNAAALGMAIAARAWSYTSGGNPALEHFDAATDEDLDITNNSWGRGAGWDNGSGTDTGNTDRFGNYDAEAGDWDAMVLLTGLIVQKSSGNDRFECDPTDSTNCDGSMGADGEWYNCITTFGVSKNLITVGATDDAGVLSGFSSTGPSDDGRIKPDVVANGTTLTSCWGGGVTLNNCTGLPYCGISGTSMSSPTTTGAVALLVDLYRQEYGGISPGPDEMKALLVNTAMDLGRPGPDFQYGHGLVDALAAAEVIQIGQVRILTDAVDQGESDSWLVEVRPGNPELRVTLNWIDYPGAPDSNNRDLINDLDVRLISPSGTLFRPFTGPQGDPSDDATATDRNGIDTVEHARVTNPQTGFWTVHVDGQSVPEGPQPYALVANSSFFLGDQPNIEVAANLSFPETCVESGLEKKVVSIFNTGGANLLVNDVAVIAGAADFELLPNPSPPFVLPPGAHIDLYVAFDPSAGGLRTGTLQILSNDADEGDIQLPMSGLADYQDVAASIDSKGYFGIVPLGYQETKELQVINQGICDLTVLGLNHAMGSTEFSAGEIEGFPAFPFTLFPGESAVIYVTYLPTNFGFDTGVFNLVTNDPDHPIIPVTVRGDCRPPNITTTGSLRFGEVCPGELVEKTLDICNTGISDLIVTSVEFDPPCDDFEIINNPYPNTVSHDFCLGVTVRYTPTGVGAHSCTLVIESNDPDEPTVTVEATGTLLPVGLDVTADVAFPPTVVQNLADCTSCEPFNVTNNGECPVTITEFSIAQPLNEFEAANLPALPITLLPGESLGDGLLAICFSPEVVQRYRTATVSVSYITNDPTVGDVETVTRELCGEGVNTGLRMVVRKDGVPMATVDRIMLFEILYPDTADEVLSIVQIDTNQNLQTTLDQPPCVAVDFHQEYGGETNPIVLTPGVYLLWVEHDFGNGVQIRKEEIPIGDWCVFEDDIALDY